jgi:hypothetical protein
MWLAWETVCSAVTTTAIHPAQSNILLKWLDISTPLVRRCTLRLMQVLHADKTWLGFRNTPDAAAHFVRESLIR